MKTSTVFTTLSAILVVLGCATTGNANDGERLSATPVDEIAWTELPDGRAIATVHGDRQTGEHTTFVRFPAGLRTALHTHSKSYDGTIVRGMARHYEPRFGKPEQWLPIGSVYRVPAGVPHISECSDESSCIFAIHQHGPFDRAIVD